MATTGTGAATKQEDVEQNETSLVVTAAKDCDEVRKIPAPLAQL